MSFRRPLLRRTLSRFYPPSGEASAPQTPVLRTPLPSLPEDPLLAAAKRLQDTDMIEFLLANSQDHIDVRRGLFGPNLQSGEQFSAFFKAQLGELNAGPVSALLADPTRKWNVKTFQALFTAAWLSHPTAKGTYAINLSDLQPPEVQAVAQARRSCCVWRFSSHYNKRGRSAADGFETVLGYEELLVHMVEDLQILALKAEGATTWAGWFEHLQGYLSKRRIAEGLPRSQVLETMAASESLLVERRATENYSLIYGQLLEDLDFDRSNKMVLARTVVEALFSKAGFSSDVNFVSDSNGNIGAALTRFCDAFDPVDCDGERPLDDKLLKDGTLAALRELADSFLRDGDAHYKRIHREIIVTPQQLDAVLARLAAGLDEPSGPLQPPNKSSAVPGGASPR